MTRTPRMFLTLLACAAAGATHAHAAAPAVSAQDRTFVATVSQGGMFEVQAGEAAAQQGNTQDIKDQGATEAHDHRLVGDKLSSIASKLDLSFPSDLNATFSKELADLKAASGPAFDRLYLKDMIVLHDKDGAAFAKEARSGSDPDLRAFAAETHRIVVRHLGELNAKPGAG